MGMRIGFSGSRFGMTDKQKETVKNLLLDHQPVWVHHGDCVGADADFHQINRNIGGIWVKGHPPIKPDFRAYCEFDSINEPKSYYVRNRDIVNEAPDLLIATPKESEEQTKGGTWYTVGYARSVKRKFIIVWPDGSIKEFDS